MLMTAVTSRAAFDGLDHLACYKVRHDAAQAGAGGASRSPRPRWDVT